LALKSFEITHENNDERASNENSIQGGQGGCVLLKCVYKYFMLAMGDLEIAPRKGHALIFKMYAAHQQLRQSQ
jgi:hypothetical protein